MLILLTATDVPFALWFFHDNTIHQFPIFFKVCLQCAISCIVAQSPDKQFPEPLRFRIVMVYVPPVAPPVVPVTVHLPPVTVRAAGSSPLSVLLMVISLRLSIKEKDNVLNPFIMNGLADHLGESTFIFRCIRSDFEFLFHFWMKFPPAKRTGPDGTLYLWCHIMD